MHEMGMCQFMKRLAGLWRAGSVGEVFFPPEQGRMSREEGTRAR